MPVRCAPNAILPLFQGWTSCDAEIEKARVAIAEWHRVLSADPRGGAIRRALDWHARRGPR